MDEWIATGSQAGAAARMGVSVKTVSTLVRQVRYAIGDPLPPRLIVMWDRFRGGVL
ncbi:MAG: helix-turn-helix domain-containing protein [Caldilineaceae bacterium]